MADPAVGLFDRRAREAARPFPSVPAGTPLARAVAALTEADSSAVVVVDGGGRPVGIVTERDVARRAALHAGPAWTVDRVMSGPVATVAADDYLFRAIAEMRRRDVRHLPVVDADGRLAGVVELDRALALADDGALRRMELLGDDDTPAGLARRKAAQPRVAAELVAEGVAAVDVLHLVAEANRDIHRRVLARAEAGLAAAGLGPPPVACTALVLGSAGRGESLLRPDQDNALILADYADDRHAEVDAWYVALAERLTAGLADAGFPLCSGAVMATNPVWRKTLPQWRDQVTLWCRRRSPVAVLHADIFFDFQPFAGAPEPAAALRAHALAMLAAHPAFLAAIAENLANHAAAIGLFGRLHTIHGEPERRGHLDLKLGGLMPLVGAVRLLALRAGIAATGTRARLDALAAAGVVEAEEASALADAFAVIVDVLLRQQLTDVAAGRSPSNDVLVRGLRRRAREQLVAALRAVDALHRRVVAELTGALW